MRAVALVPHAHLQCSLDWVGPSKTMPDHWRANNVELSMILPGGFVFSSNHWWMAHISLAKADMMSLSCPVSLCRHLRQSKQMEVTDLASDSIVCPGDNTMQIINANLLNGGVGGGGGGCQCCTHPNSPFAFLLGWTLGTQHQVLVTVPFREVASGLSNRQYDH